MLKTWLGNYIEYKDADFLCFGLYRDVSCCVSSILFWQKSVFDRVRKRNQNHVFLSNASKCPLDFCVIIDNLDIGNEFFEYVRVKRNCPLACKRITYRSTFCLLMFCAFLTSIDWGFYRYTGQAGLAFILQSSIRDAPILLKRFSVETRQEISWLKRTTNFKAKYFEETKVNLYRIEAFHYLVLYEKYFHKLFIFGKYF